MPGLASVDAGQDNSPRLEGRWGRGERADGAHAWIIRRAVQQSVWTRAADQGDGSMRSELHGWVAEWRWVLDDWAGGWAVCCMVR